MDAGSQEDAPAGLIQFNFPRLLRQPTSQADQNEGPFTGASAGAIAIRRQARQDARSVGARPPVGPATPIQQAPWPFHALAVEAPPLPLLPIIGAKAGRRNP